MTPRRFEVWVVNLDPTIGSEIRKTRPAVVVSPDELNAHLRTVVIVPLTTGRAYPFRVVTNVEEKTGIAAVDQLRAIDKGRLVRRLGLVDEATGLAILDALGQFFAP